MRAIVTAVLVMAGLSTLFLYVDIVDQSQGRISLLEFVIAAGGSLAVFFLMRFALRAAVADEAHRARRKLLGN